MENHRDAFPRSIALVLSGGVARGAFHLGAIRALIDAGIEIEVISGTSIGAVIGALYLQGSTPEEILEFFSSKAFRKSIKFSLFQEGFFEFDQQSKEFNNFLKYKNIEELKKPLIVSAVDIDRDKIVRFKRGEIVPIILASSALTPIFKPITYEGNRYCDGGIFDNLPVGPILAYKLPIVGINLHPRIDKKPKSKLDFLKKLTFLTWHHSIAKNIEQCDYYLSVKELDKISLFSLKNLKSTFELGRVSMSKMIIENRVN